jgi:RecA/RadA recombinase
MKRVEKEEPLSKQMKKAAAKVKEEKPEYDGNFETVISTGSTLLDLEISGGRIRGGGIPSGGMFVEIFGPNGCGKTILLCEIAGDVQRKGGDVRFDDPEARLNKQFARLFDLDTDTIQYGIPNKVTEVFDNIRNWKPAGKGVNGTFTDSLAALSTEIEMDNDEGDKMGMRRAKEFSEGLRKNARLLVERNILMVASNQVRENQDKMGKFDAQYKSTGGFAIGFYASLRLRASQPVKLYQEEDVHGKTVKKAIGVTTTYEVFKSSIWKPYGSAPVTILFDYGIDDIRENLKFIKTYTGATGYSLDGDKLGKSLDESVRTVEYDRELIKKLKNETIDLWEEINHKFDSNRKKIR